MSVKHKLTPWAKGPPPSIGWWNASFFRHPGVRRWWNGTHWSLDVQIGDGDATMRRKQNKKATAGDIEWRGLARRPKS